MFKSILKWICVVIFSLSFNPCVSAATTNLFNISEEGVAETININLCLNGTGPATCQNYTVNHGVLILTTVIPGHTYSGAGIKLNTSGYTLTEEDSGCTPISNGYCLFSVSDTSSATIIIIPSLAPPDPGKATISVTGSPLGLNITKSPGSLTITNQSTTTTAKDIVSNFTNTALDGKVQETGNTCQSVPPLGSCTLTYSAGSTSVPETKFLIQGTNTLPVSAIISVSPAAQPEIDVINPHLTLETNSSAGSMTIQNTSNSVTALNIASNFAGTALNGNVTETGNTCSSVAPGASCTLTFTPGSTTVAETAFPIQGTNTNTVNGFIAIHPSATAALQVSNSPLVLNTNGATGTLTITNLSSTITATNITSSFTGTALNGNVTESGNTCASLAPNASCTLTYTPGGTVVAQTDFPISGSNTDTVLGAIQIESLSIGTDFGGGKVACLTSGGGSSNLIAATSDTRRNLIWQQVPLFATGATSATNGATNTSTIVAAIGQSPAYAAPRCAAYQIDSAGNIPCRSGYTCYNDWYLPASNELGCLYQNQAAVGGFSGSLYWASTEQNKNSSKSLSFSNGSSPAKNKVDYQLSVRCVRSFTP